MSNSHVVAVPRDDKQQAVCLGLKAVSEEVNNNEKL